ncbi:HAD-IA family hydrolase [Jhaorihella thermophila]|uniref:Putative hydrolase of the HAD superfamily n=1 Tax=Jhaorihella thermophila TaxID=488547 RepID=A0A1H5VL72_9RHOB|nr:HAD-IA family hydrolase [Jhaorihella thermophila]SEF87581.1 putative hydrolase of the HAD superfamily [Jhaorihella thermophila]
MDLSRINCLTFDVVGTLIDFEAGIVEFFRARGCDRDREEILAAFGRAEAVQQDLTPETPFTQMLSPIYDRMAPEMGLPPGRGEAFRASIPGWPAFPDSVEALRRLRSRFRLVALTNADNRALSHMASTLDNPFDDTVTCEDVGVNKPDPQVFAYCRGRQSIHGVTLASTMHVAQSQYHDIGVAKRLGYLTTWIERRSGADGFGASPVPEAVTQPDLHFTTLTELADHLDAALAPT